MTDAHDVGQEAGPVDGTPELREQVARALAFCRRALRHWYAMLASLVLGGLACATYVVLQPPVYRSETLLLHTDGIASADTTEQPTAPRNIAARVQEILMSRQLLVRVLDELGLYADVRRQYGPVDAVDELRKHIQFKAPGGNTFRIAFDGDSPEQARRVTARLAELVIDGDSELRSGQALLTQTFLTKEKTGTESRLDDAERQLASFLAEHPRFALDTTPLTSGAAVRASVQQAARPSARWAAVPRAHASAPAAAVLPPPVVASPRAPSQAMREAATALAAARATLADKLAQFTPAHPDVRAAQASVARAEARFEDAEAAEESRADPVLAPTLAPPVAETTERQTRYALVPLRDSGTAAPATQDLVALETEWATLTRSVIEARQHHDQVEAALFRAEIAASSVSDGNHGTQMSVIDRAYLPLRPNPPGRGTIGAIASALSVLLGALAMLLCAALDDRVYGPRDVAGIARLLVQVPRVRRWKRSHVAS